MTFCIVDTYTGRQDCPQVSQRSTFGFFYYAGATRCSDEGQIWRRGVDQNFTLISAGWGIRPKNCNFTKFGNINARAHYGHNPCTILVKFSGFVNNSVLVLRF